jgi:hypothetical protein
MKARDLTGAVFGRLTVVRLHSHKRFPSGSTMNLWLCRCACGAERVVLGSNMRSGHTTSCGCLMLDGTTLFLGRFEAKEQAEIAAVAARRVRDVMLAKRAA